MAIKVVGRTNNYDFHKKMIFRFLLPFQNGKIQKTVKLILNSMSDSNLMFRVTVRENHKCHAASTTSSGPALARHQHTTTQI